MPSKIKEKKLALVTLGVLLAFSIMYNPSVTSQTTELTFTYAEPYQIMNFDPVHQLLTPSDRWMNSIFASLYQRNVGSRDFIPVLALDYPTVTRVNETDGTVMIVKVALKQGLKFSNGYALNSTDVAYSFQMNLMKAITTQQYDIWTKEYRFTNDSVRIINEYEVEFRFKVLRSDYLEILSFKIFCEEIFRPAIESGIYTFNDPSGYYLVGAGPFKIDHIVTGNSSDFIFLIPNEYWSLTGLPTSPVDRLVFVRYSKEVALTGLLNGTVDAVDYSYRFNFTNIAGASGLVGIRQSDYTQGLWPNHMHPVWGHTAQLDAYIGQNFTYSQTNQTFTVRSFWDEISNGFMSETDRIEAARLVRAAMSYAFSREHIASTITMNTTLPASNLIPPYSYGWNSSIPQIQKDLNYSRLLIQQAFALAGWNNITIDTTSPGIFVGDLARYFPDFWSVTAIAPATIPYRDQWTNYVTSELEGIGFNFTSVVTGTWSYILSMSLTYPITDAEYNLTNGLHTPIPLQPQGGYDLMFLGFVTWIRWDLTSVLAFDEFRPVGVNFINYWDAELEFQLQSMQEEINTTIWQFIMNDIQLELFNKNPGIPILYLTAFFAYRDIWTGLAPVLLRNYEQPWWELQVIPELTTTTSTLTSTTTSIQPPSTTTTSSINQTQTFANTTTSETTPTTPVDITSPITPPFLSLPGDSPLIGFAFILAILARRPVVSKKKR